MKILKASAKNNFLLLSILLTAIVFILKNNHKLNFDPSINIYLKNEGELTTVTVKFERSLALSEVERARDDKSVDIYRNGKIYFRAYSSKILEETDIPDQGYITIIFDDGWLDTFDYALPVLKKYDFQGTVAIIESYVDKPGALSSRQIRYLVDNGWDIVSHALSDTPLTDLSIEEQERQLKESKEFSWQKFWATEYFIFPSGAYNEDLLNLTKKYYKAARIYEEEVNKSGFDPYLINIESLEKTTKVEDLKKIIDNIEEKKLWLVLVGHHISSKDLGEYTLHPNLLDEILKYIKGKNIKVATFGQALQELNPGLSLIKEGELVWKFKRVLIGTNSNEIFVVVDNKKSAPININ